MKTLSAHKTRSIIEQTIIDSLFVKNEGTLSVTTALLKKLNAVQLNNNTFMLYGCKITVSENDKNYTVTTMKSKDYKKIVTDVTRKKDLMF